MSVKAPLQSIFSHLYPDPNAALAVQEPPVSAADGGEPETKDAAAEPVGGDPEPTAPPADTADAWGQQIMAIEGSLASMLEESMLAAEQLNVKRTLAMRADIQRNKELDYDHGREHRKTGLPVGPSLLETDAGLIVHHGLLHAHELLVQVQMAQAARSAEPQGRDLIAEEASSRPPPHYMKSTANFDATYTSKGAIISTVKSLRQLALANRERALAEAIANGTAPPQRDDEERARARAKADAMMSMDQQEAELKVMRRLQGPMDFIRNPRFVLPPRRAPEDAPLEPLPVPRRNDWIHANPEKVHFVAYEAGGVYELPVQLHNVSTLSRRVRVLPPSTRYFSTTLLSYGAEHGTIAPGMHATFRVRFAPDSLADYDDFVVIQTEKESFPLPLHARRSPPVLTLPSVLQCGFAFVGGTSSLDFGAQNTGGAGRFFVLDKAKWDAGDREVQPTLSIGPFVVSPTFLDLQPMDHFRVSVTYSPEAPGPSTATLLLVCDNCQLKEVTLSGSGCVAQLNIESVDGQPPLTEDGGAAAQDLYDFGDVGVLTTQKSTVRVTNVTPLPLQFEWDRYLLPPTLFPFSRQRGVPPDTFSTEQLGPRAAVGAKLPSDPEQEQLLREMLPFTITPPEGYLQAGETTSFEVHFSPILAELAGAAVVLRPCNVPERALPGYKEPGGAPASSGYEDDEGAQILEVGLKLLGRGTGADLKLDPLALVLPGGTTIRTSVTHSFSLFNDNGAERTWRWLEADLPAELEELEGLGVVLDPPMGTLPAEAGSSVTITMTPRALGHLQRYLHFGVSPHGRTLTLRLEVFSVGPHVHIKTSKLDFGLCPLGDTKSLTLEFENLSAREAKWILVPAPLPRTDPKLAASAQAAAAAQAAALGLPLPPPPLTLTTWAAWDEKARQGDQSRIEHGMLDAMLLDAHAATGLRPSLCCGTIGAHQTTQVTVTVDAACEQSLRRLLELKVEDGGESAHVAARSEVVARKCALSPSAHPLGTTYVRVPVVRTLTLTNLTRIATSFECLHTVSKGSADVQMEPASGVLAPAAKLTITVTIISETDGPMSLFAGCVLHGGRARPVGCKFSAEVQGLTVFYECLSQYDARLVDMPPTIEPPEDVVAEDGAVAVRPPPVSPPLPMIDYGEGVPIFEQRTLVLLITNMSAVRTRYTLRAERFPAAPLPLELVDPPVPEDYTQTATALAKLKQADLLAKKQAEAEELRKRLTGTAPPGGPPLPKPPGTAGSKKPPGTAASTKSQQQPPGTAQSKGTSARGSTQLAFHRPVLGDAHERLQPFSSESGTTFCAQRQLRRREDGLLKEGQGACFEISPSEGTLEAWAQLAITISVHSNMWGLYDDTLIADVLGLPEVRIPLRAAVEGSPIKLHDATLGLSNITTPQTLSWAPVAQGAAPVKKTIRVLNNGPLPATLAWEVLQAPDPEKPLAAKLRLAKDGSGPVLELDRRPLPPFASRAFRITPATDVLPAGGERRFEVVFDASAEMGSGEAAFEAMLNAALTHPMPVTLADGTATDKHPELRLRLSGHSLIPRLAMSERSKLKFKVSPTMAPDDPAYTRTLTLTNDSKTTLEFTLAIPPPFVLVEGRCSIAQFKIMGNKQVDNTSPFCLPPQSSLQAVIRYVPSKRRRRGGDGDGDDDTRSVVSTAKSTASGADTDGGGDEHVDFALDSVEKRGDALRITYTNGSLQSFPLLAVTTRPYVEISPVPGEMRPGRGQVVHGVPTIKMEPTHLSLLPVREVTIHNPTEAVCDWTLVHIPYKPPPAASAAGAREKAFLIAGGKLPTDDPTVFEFSTYGGTLPARAGLVPTRYPLSVRFKPKVPGTYRCVWALKVRAGMTQRIEVNAEATMREEDVEVVVTDKHLRLMQIGEVA